MRNLPAAPTIVSTGVSLASADFIPWTDTRMVQVDAATQTFRVLELGPISGTVTTVPSPVALNAPPTGSIGGYAWGGARWGDFAGTGPGPDALPGTSDDQLVTLFEFAGSYLVSALDLPSWVQPTGAAFNGAGTMALWNQNASPSITVSLLNAPNFWNGATTLTFGTGANPGPCSGPNCMYVIGDPGDTFRAAVYDDAAVDNCYRFIENAGTAPYAGASYCDDGQGFDSTLVADHSLARYSGIFGDVLAYARFTPQGELGFTTPLPGVPAGFAEPHPGSLVVQMDLGDAIVYGDLLGTNTPVTLSGTGNWYREPLDIGPGRVGGFFTTASGLPPTEFVVISAPGSPVVGSSASWPFEFSVAPVVPQLGQTLRLQLNALDPTYIGPASLVLATDLGSPLPLTAAPFAPGSVVHVDLSSPLFIAPVPMSAGFGELAFNTTGVPTSLAGFSIYAQALFFDPWVVAWFLSDARLVVLG